MKKTKELILETALALFNEEGYKETTLRGIATRLGISQGNLNYHYKTKNNILEKLYFDLVEKMDAEMKSMIMSQSILQVIFDSSKISMSQMYNYRFLMRDLHKILKENNSISSHFSQLQKIRVVQFTQIFDNLVSHGILRAEEFENEYKRLYERMNILGDNWINAQELLNRKMRKPIHYYQSLLFEIIYPYLTKKGKLEYSKALPHT